jgi:ssDNA-binding replication factor A large subunit
LFGKCLREPETSHEQNIVGEECLREYLLNIRDLKPGMSRVSMKVKVVSVSEPKHVTSSKGVEHEILELEVEDETGSMVMDLWNERIIPLNAGDTLQIENCFVTSFKGVWRINVGKYGEVTKV